NGSSPPTRDAAAVSAVEDDYDERVGVDTRRQLARSTLATAPRAVGTCSLLSRSAMTCSVSASSARDGVHLLPRQRISYAGTRHSPQQRRRIHERAQAQSEVTTMPPVVLHSGGASGLCTRCTQRRPHALVFGN